MSRLCVPAAFTLVVTSLMLMAGCASRPAASDKPFPALWQNLDQAVAAYKGLREEKAFAAAAISGGRYVFGLGYGAPTQQEANEVALRQCRESAATQAVVSECELVYENDLFVYPPSLFAHLPSVPENEQRPGPSAQSPSEPLPTPRVSSTGSGVFVSTDGLVLTAAHVIHGASKIEVSDREGRRWNARVLASSERLDLALLKTDATPATFFSVRLGDPLAGARVFTVGYPLPGVLGQEPKVSEGIVNAVTGLGDDAGFMQISIPVQPGNSGGPVITEDGQLVGIVSSSAAIGPFLKKTGTIPQNVNWAVRSSLAVPLIGKEGIRLPATSRERSIERGIKASVLILAE